MGMKGGDNEAGELASASVASSGAKRRKDSGEAVMAAFVSRNPFFLIRLRHFTTH